MGIAIQSSAPGNMPAAFLNPSGPRVVIIGAGPVGMNFAEKLKADSASPFNILVFNGENCAPYDRIKLTQLLTQQVNYPDIFWQQQNTQAHSGHSKSSLDIIQRTVASIDTENKIITDRQGDRYPYDRLVLATGSLPHIPQVPNIELPGVYTFRNMRDVEFLMARTHRSRHCVVVGGGLLGLEAAKGLKQKNTLVTLVHQAPRLMNRQLDDLNGELLLLYVKRFGINVITNDGLAGVLGDVRATGISTRLGKKLDCDTVVVCTGIKPNVELALAGGIKIARGIVVDAQLQTSCRDVYAIGECTEFNNEVYGLVAPGLEQAAILAENFKRGSATFLGTQPYTKLKVIDVEVSSLGNIADINRHPKLKVLHYQQKSDHRQSHQINDKLSLGKTRSLALVKGKIVGACSVGPWPEWQRLRETYSQHRRVFPWQQWLFQLTGKLWLNEDNDPSTWPANAIICQCKQVNLGAINTTIEHGCYSLKAIAHECGAGSVCGSCQPTLSQLLQNQLDTSVDETAAAEPTGIRPVLTTSIIAIAGVALILLLPGISTPTSVQEFSLSMLVNDKLFKQVSGFSLLGITLLGLMLTLRKRLHWEFLGQFQHWRTVHTVAGVMALLILLAHTGAVLGEQLNRWLMLNYLTVALIGSILGLAIGLSKRPIIRNRLRTTSFWAHVLTVWPLPILVSAHILSSYYF